MAAIQAIDTSIEKDGLSFVEIKSILPHRFPFLLLDRITALDLEHSYIVGVKNVSGNESFFEGHFPSMPIMPGVLILEALAQAGGVLVHKKGYSDKIALLMSVKSAKFRKPVIPGDVLHLVVQANHLSSKGGKMIAEARVKGKTVVEVEFGFGLIAE